MTREDQEEMERQDQQKTREDHKKMTKEDFGMGGGARVRNCCHLRSQDCITNHKESEENEKENSLHIVK